MEEEKEKKIEIQKESRNKDNDDISQLVPIPNDLILEILSRLPAKSIVRFLCVSKLWSSFTKLPSFINSFASSQSRPRSLLVSFYRSDMHLISFFPQEQNPDGSYPPVYSYQMTNTEALPKSPSESVKGLVLCSKLKVWNPTMRQFLALPKPAESTGESYYLGYDPVEGKHKVLYVNCYDRHQQPQVLTLGAQESWRIVTESSPMRPIEYGSRRCINGVIYYHATFSDHKPIIMSFSVRSEKFSPIKYPEKRHDIILYPKIIPYEGRLALVFHNSYDDGIDLYILKDADGHQWTHSRFILPLYNREWRDRKRFRGVTDAGELIFTSSSLSKSFFILYFDPRRDRIREASFEVVDDELHGATLIQVLPNHIESLASL